MRALLDLGASRPQNMQQPAGFGAGVSTEVPAPARQTDGMPPEDQLRLTELEARLQALTKQSGGLPTR